MGGGPVIEDVYVPYHWPFPQIFNSPLYTTSWPGFYGFDVQSPLDGFRSVPQDWPYCTAYKNHRHEEPKEAIADRDQVQNLGPDPKKGERVFVKGSNASLQTKLVTQSDFQSEEVEKRGGFQSEETEKEGLGFQPEENENEAEFQPGEAEENESEFQPENEQGKESEIQPEKMEEEIGSDEERRAATVVQSRYRGHLVRMTRPLVQLRTIAEIQARLKMLKEQAGSRAFSEELRKEKSMAKVGFEEDTLALLMELDNVQGSHPHVRQIRKWVVREIVELQETVDALVAGIRSNRLQ